MLILLFMFIDKISFILTLLITIGISFSTMIILQEILINIFQTKCELLIEKKYGPESCQFTIIDALSFGIGASIALSWLLTKNWILNNILASCICFTALKTIRLN